MTYLFLIPSSVVQLQEQCNWEARPFLLITDGVQCLNDVVKPCLVIVRYCEETGKTIWRIRKYTNETH